jgi:hypothetical protein
MTQAALLFALTLAHLARWATAIFRLAAGERVRFRWVEVRIGPRLAVPSFRVPTIPSIAEIASSNFFT